MRWLIALALLLLAPSARAQDEVAYQSYNVAGGGGASWQGFSPTWIPGLALWLRADLGVTAVAGPVTATGTTPPTVTLAGTPTAAQTSAATPYVELDCTTLGALGTSKYAVKVNGATTATNVASAASGVVLTGSGLTAGWAVGASATNDVYTSNVVASAWADLSGLAHNFAQATAGNRMTVASASASNSLPMLYSATSGTQQIADASFPTLTVPFWYAAVTSFSSNSPGGNQYLVDFSGGNVDSLLQLAGVQGVQQRGGNSTAAPGQPAAFLAEVLNNAATTSGVAVNGSTYTNVSSNAFVSSTTGGMCIGGTCVTANGWTGGVQAVIVATIPPDAGARARLHAYASNVFGTN